MEYLKQYFLTNFFLICLAFGVIFMVLRNYRAKRIAVLMPILIVSSAVLLSIVYQIELISQDYNIIFLATFCCVLGFCIRPLVVYFFMRMTITNKIILRISVGLIILNAVVYSLALLLFLPNLSRAVFWYEMGAEKIEIHKNFLFFFSYFVAGAMLGYLIVTSIRSLKGRRRFDALASLVCVVFIGIAVVLESAFIADTLLNTTIAISCLFYIVHLYQQASSRDGMTGLFDRKTYYADMSKVGNRVQAVALIDMNSLKYINDTQGHPAGDKAIITIAETIQASIEGRSMYAYRMGGDEFMIVSLSSKDNAIVDICNYIREHLQQTPYSVAIGYAKRDGVNDTTRDMGTRAEEMMYADKAEYYQVSGRERRKI